MGESPPDVSLVQLEMASHYDLVLMHDNLEVNSVMVRGKNLHLTALLPNSKAFPKMMHFEGQIAAIELVESYYVLLQVEETHPLKMEVKIVAKHSTLLPKLNLFVFIVVLGVPYLTDDSHSLVLVDHFKDFAAEVFIEVAKSAQQNFIVFVIGQMHLLDLKDSGKLEAAQGAQAFDQIKNQDILRIKNSQQTKLFSLLSYFLYL